MTSNLDMKYSKIYIFYQLSLYFLPFISTSLFWKTKKLNSSEAREMFCSLEFWHMINITVCLSTFSQRINNSISILCFLKGVWQGKPYRIPHHVSMPRLFVFYSLIAQRQFLIWTFKEWNGLKKTIQLFQLSLQ